MNSRKHNYFQSTAMTIQEIESEETDSNFISSYAANMAILGNATAPDYTEKMFKRLKDSQYNEAMALAEALDENHKPIYQNAANDKTSSKESQRRCIKAKKDFMKEIVEETLAPSM